jgi:hypothetical protein
MEPQQAGAPVGQTLIDEVAKIVERPMPEQVQYYRDNFEVGYAQNNANQQQPGGFVPQAQFVPRNGQQGQDQPVASVGNMQTSIETGQYVNPQ